MDYRIDEDGRPFREPADHREPAPGRGAERTCAAERAERALSVVDARERRILEMRRLQGATLAQTAEAIGVSQNRVGQLERRAFRRIYLRLRELRAVEFLPDWEE